MNTAAQPPDGPRAALLVDDNADDRLFFEFAWQKASLPNAVQFVASCREALNYLEGLDEFADRSVFPFPALIVLDMRLPDGTANDLIRRIKADDRFRQIGVVILSGSAEEECIQEAYRNGADLFLVKPSIPSELQKIVCLLGEVLEAPERLSAAQPNFILQH